MRLTIFYLAVGSAGRLYGEMAYVASVGASRCKNASVGSYYHSVNASREVTIAVWSRKEQQSIHELGSPPLAPQPGVSLIRRVFCV